jgi:hypothetical protein
MMPPVSESTKCDKKFFTPMVAVLVFNIRPNTPPEKITDWSESREFMRKNSDAEHRRN